MLPKGLLVAITRCMHVMMGSFAVFCLYNALTVPGLSSYLLLMALKWGVLAVAILYVQTRYLDD
jgi:high-affinity Fe2+/Pb2+ permease